MPNIVLLEVYVVTLKDVLSDQGVVTVNDEVEFVFIAILVSPVINVFQGSFIFFVNN